MTCSPSDLSVAVCSYFCGHGHSSMRFNTSVGLWSSGEILAEYFPSSTYGTFSSDSSCPQIFRTESVINFSWGIYSPLLDDATYSLQQCQSSIHQNLFSVRWRGFIRPKFSEETTFILSSTGRASLSIGNISILNSSTIELTSSASILLRSSDYYSFTIDYQSDKNAPGLQLKWKSASLVEEVIPSNSFFTRNWIVENSMARVVKLCNFSCMASGSAVTDVQAAHATAGVAAHFRIKFNDAYVENSLLFSSPSFIATASSPNSEQILFQRIDGLRNINNTAVSFYPSADRLGGLTATFYTDSIFSAPAAVASFGRSSFQMPSVFDTVDLASQIDASNVSAPFIRESLVSLKSNSWSVRYAGWLLPSMSSEIYTISFEKPINTQISLSVDGKFVLDANLDHNPSATISFAIASFVPILILYSQTNFVSKPVLKLMYKHRFMSTSALVPSNNLCSLGLVHSVSFMPPLIKGTHDVSISIVNPSSLLLQSFSDEKFRVPLAQLPILPLSSVAAGTIVFDALPMNALECRSLRWTGYMKPNSLTLTFQIAVPSFIDTAALWLGGSLKFHVDSAMSARAHSVVHIVSNSEALFHFKFELSSSTRQFSGLSFTILSSSGPQVFAPFSFGSFTMDVNPSFPCTSLSKVAVSDATFLTAGVPFSAAIHVKDIFGNPIFGSFAAAVAICPSESCLNKRVFGNLSYSNSSAAVAVLKPLTAGSSRLNAAILQRGAWMASVAFESTGAQSNHTVKSDGVVGSAGSGNQRASFTGLVYVGSAVNVSFHVTCSACSAASIVVAAAASSILNSVVSAFGREYWYVESSARFSGATSVVLSISCNGLPVRKVTSAELHWLDDQFPSVQVLVQPGTACATRSTVTGSTLSTSGLPVSFSISAFYEM